MILSVEWSELNTIYESLTEKLKFLEKDSYLEYIIKEAQQFVKMARESLKRYENQINMTYRKELTRQFIAKG